MEGLVGALAAGGASFLACWALIRLGRRGGFVDRPDEHLKTHATPTPPLGGIGVLAGLAAGSLVTDGPGAFFWLGAVAIVALGLVDDLRSLSPRLRLGAELAVAIVVVAGVDTSGWGTPSVVAAVVLTVVAVNAVNLFDGLDGLAGGTALVTAVGLTVLAFTRGPVLSEGWLLGGALVGFVVWNWHPARLFLGDNGAYLVGLSLAYLALGATPTGELVPLLLAFACLGVVVFDLVSAVIRRWRAGRPLFAGDRSHLYDQLVDRGLAVPTVSAGAALAQVAAVAAVVAADAALVDGVAFAVLAAAAVAVVGAAGRAGFLGEGGAD